MPSLPTVGGSTGTWGTELNAWLLVGHNSAGNNIGGTKRLSIPLNVPDASGNGYAGQIATANIRQTLAAFLKDVDGSWYGKVYVPADYSSTPKIILRILANATSGVTRLNVHTHAKTDSESVDASLTSETAQDITVPATAYMLKDVTFTLASSPAAGDSLTVRVQHEGNHANDTLAVDTLLYDAIFEYQA